MQKHIKLVIALFVIAAPSVGFSECVITGCNGEICADTAIPSIGICQWKDEYACYKQFGVCAADANGSCAWQPNPELDQCLNKLQQTQEGVFKP